MLMALSAIGGVVFGSPTLRVVAGETPVSNASRAVLSGVQSEMVGVLAEMIIPATDTPGAIEAGVPALVGAKTFLDYNPVLNAWNQAHDVPNLYVTDGASMSSCGVVNPSLTFMALTARAANHAVEQLRAERPVVASPDDGAAMP
jgi:hypothetical protein